MEATVSHDLDGTQVKKAIQALLAHQKTKGSANSLLLNEHEPISLMVTVWKIPPRSQTIKIPLPHSIRPDTCDVCLFTRDEPNMTPEQTEKFYKTLLSKHGVTQISEVIPLRRMKKEYKPFEAKRHLVGSYDLFLSDDRIRRLLPSHIGKHFYKEKKEPQSVNLKSKNLAAELNRFIQGTAIHVTNRGCCYSVRVGNTGMEVSHIVENTLAIAQVLAKKLPMTWKNVKVLHLKTQTSVALPVFNSSLDNISELGLTVVKKDKQKRKNNKKKSANKKKEVTSASAETSEALAKEGDKTIASPKQKVLDDDDDDDEEIPQLVPIEEPKSKKKDQKKKLDTTESPKSGGKRKGSTESAPKPSVQKRKISVNERKTPSKQEETAVLEPLRKEKDSTPKDSILKGTPKKTTGQSVQRLTKSAKKVPQTPKLKQKKKMKTPQSA